MENHVGKLTLKWLREEYLFIFCIVLADFPWLKIFQTKQAKLQNKTKKQKVNERAKEELYSNVSGGTTQIEYTI